MVPAQLAEIQNSMMRYLLSPGPLEARFDEGGSPLGLELARQVAPSPGLKAAQRLAIYRKGYLLRLLETLREDFPNLRRAMGDPLFDFFATSYVRRNPSRNPSLTSFGANFPKFLQQTQGQGRDEQDGRVSLRFAVALAEFERVRAEVLRVDGNMDAAYGTRTDAWSALCPGPAPRNCQIVPNPTLRLLQVPPRVLHYLNLIPADDAQIEKGIERGVALSRSQFRLTTTLLSAGQWALLQLIQREPGLPWREALARCKPQIEPAWLWAAEARGLCARRLTAIGFQVGNSS